MNCAVISRHGLASCVDMAWPHMLTGIVEMELLPSFGARTDRHMDSKANTENILNI